MTSWMAVVKFTYAPSAAVSLLEKWEYGQLPHRVIVGINLEDLYKLSGPEGAFNNCQFPLIRIKTPLDFKSRSYTWSFGTSKTLQRASKYLMREKFLARTFHSQGIRLVQMEFPGASELISAHLLLISLGACVFTSLAH